MLPWWNDPSAAQCVNPCSLASTISAPVSYALRRTTHIGGVGEGIRQAEGVPQLPSPAHGFARHRQRLIGETP